MENKNQNEGPETSLCPIIYKETPADSQDSYTCTECSSHIEITSIDAKKNAITFKCENHGEKTMPINRYISLMEKNTYPFSICSICSLKQNENKDTPNFYYCTKCQKIICSNKACINKHFDENKPNHENRKQEYFIENNKRGVQCSLHQKKENVAFCFDCNRHLCKDCLKSGVHLKHSKATMLEIEPSDEDKKQFNDIIKKYKQKKLKLEKEKEKIEKELIDEKSKKIKELKTNFSKNLKENEKKKQNELNELRLKYENDKKLMEKKYEEIKDKLTNDCKNDEEEINEVFEEKSEKLECNKKIKEIGNLIRIDEIVKNAQEKNKSNYFNNINFNTVLENQKNINELFEQKEKNINVNENDNLNNRKDLNLEEENEKSLIIFSSDPIKINSFINIVENSYADCFDQNSFLVYNSVNNNKLILVYSTKQKSIIFYDIISKKTIHEIEKAHESNIVSFRINLYNKENNIILSVTQSDIKLWDINNNYNCILQLNNIYNKENLIASACLLNIRNNNLIITCSLNSLCDNKENIKILYLKENKINKTVEIENSSDGSYFIDIYYDNVNSKYYIITGNIGNVKSFDYETKKIYHTYCDEDDGKDRYHISVMIYDDKGKLALIDSCKDGKIRIWDFHKNILINKIYFDDIIPSSLCLWNDKYLFFGTEEKGIKLVDLYNKNLCNTLNALNGDELCSIVKIKHPEYGECLLSQNDEESPIKIWISK